jgi:hypothetical protein
MYTIWISYQGEFITLDPTSIEVEDLPAAQFLWDLLKAAGTRMISARP